MQRFAADTRMGPMSRRKLFRTILLHCWPGLAELWTGGSLRGLTIAVIFGVVLQLAMVASLLWPGWLGPLSRTVVWFCVVGFWCIGAAEGFARACGWGGPRGTGIDVEHLFQTAQREYLRGEWQEAERLLVQILAADAGDVDARILLAMVYRRSDRLGPARKQLRQLSAMEGAAKWQFEVLGERQLLKQRERELRRPRTRARRTGAEAA
jgi:hypothetical protein